MNGRVEHGILEVFTHDERLLFDMTEREARAVLILAKFLAGSYTQLPTRGLEATKGPGLRPPFFGSGAHLTVSNRKPEK